MGTFLMSYKGTFSLSRDTQFHERGGNGTEKLRLHQAEISGRIERKQGKQDGEFVKWAGFR